MKSWHLILDLGRWITLFCARTIQNNFFIKLVNYICTLLNNYTYRCQFLHHRNNINTQRICTFIRPQNRCNTQNIILRDKQQKENMHIQHSTIPTHVLIFIPTSYHRTRPYLSFAILTLVLILLLISYRTSCSSLSFVIPSSVLTFL